MLLHRPPRPFSAFSSPKQQRTSLSCLLLILMLLHRTCLLLPDSTQAPVADNRLHNTQHNSTLHSLLLRLAITFPCNSSTCYLRLAVCFEYFLLVLSLLNNNDRKLTRSMMTLFKDALFGTNPSNKHEITFLCLRNFSEIHTNPWS